MIPPMDRKHGEYPLEKLPTGWANACVQIKHRDGTKTSRIEILDLKTVNGQFVRYPQEPMAMVAFKCFGLFVMVLPVYFVMYTAYHLIRLPVVTYAPTQRP